MSLEIISRVVARYLAAAELPVGKTLVQGNVRVHRYVDSIKVTNLENAGKRGKTVDELIVMGYRWEKPFFDEVSNAISDLTSYEGILSYVRGLPKDKITYEVNRLRGVDVEPAGEVFQFKNKNDLGFRVSPHDFMVNHHAPMTHPKTGKPSFYQDILYAPYKKKDAMIFYAWVSAGNRSKLNQMDIADLRKLWHELGVKYDSH